MRVLLTGTGTDVGKTWVGARLAPLLGAAAGVGGGVKAWKPAQSFAPGDGPTDADILAAATGQAPHDVCPPHRWYPMALAPPEAADELGLPPFTVADLVAEMPDGDEVLVIEGVGGPRSPLAADGDTVTLGRLVEPHVAVLVAHAGLGAINDVRLSAEPLFEDLLLPTVVFLNRFDGGDTVHRRNRAFLERDGFDVVDDVASLVERLLSVRL